MQGLSSCKAGWQTGHSRLGWILACCKIPPLVHDDVPDSHLAQSHLKMCSPNFQINARFGDYLLVLKNLITVNFHACTFLQFCLEMAIFFNPA